MSELLTTAISAVSLLGVLAIVWFRRRRRKKVVADLGSWTIP